MYRFFCLCTTTTSISSRVYSAHHTNNSTKEKLFLYAIFRSFVVCFVGARCCTLVCCVYIVYTRRVSIIYIYVNVFESNNAIHSRLLFHCIGSFRCRVLNLICILFTWYCFLSFLKKYLYTFEKHINKSI